MFVLQSSYVNFMSLHPAGLGYCVCVCGGGGGGGGCEGQLFVPMSLTAIGSQDH